VQSSLLLTGIGLRTPHYTEFLKQQPPVAWVEVHSENYFCEGGKPIQILDTIRSHYPVSLHGVSLSLGSTDELNWQHLKQLRDLINHVNPCLVSEHLSWSSIDGQYLHDLLPLPYTEEALAHVAARIQVVQDFLQRQILIENISSYVQFTASTISEPEFLCAVAEQSGCGIVLDINNIYVTATNLGFNPATYFDNLPTKQVQELHVGGFSTSMINDREVLIDSHNRPVVPAVWDLYKKAVELLGRKPTIVEWDTDLPSLETLCLEAYRAEKIMRETYVAAKLTE
jgi:uncharacterized protein (UPF0276 family)